MAIWGKKREEEQPPQAAPVPGQAPASIDPSVEIDLDEDDVEAEASSPGTSTPAATSSPAMPASNETFIGDGMEIKGSVSTASGLVVAGFIEGDVNSGGHVEIWPDAIIQGSVSAQSVNVAGKVEGNVTTSGRLQITASGQVRGDVEVKSLQVEEGGGLLGRCKMV